MAGAIGKKYVGKKARAINGLASSMKNALDAALKKRGLKKKPGQVWREETDGHFNHL